MYLEKLSMNVTIYLNGSCFTRPNTVRILPCFQEEVMVQEDPIELEKMKA